MSDEIIKSPTSPGNILTPKLKWVNNSKIAEEFKRSCLKQDKTTFTYRNVVNWFIVYELDTWCRDLNTKFTVGDYLFGDVKLTKNADPEKYGCNCYGIGFNPRSNFSKVKMSLFLV